MGASYIQYKCVLGMITVNENPLGTITHIQTKNNAFTWTHHSYLIFIRSYHF